MRRPAGVSLRLLTYSSEYSTAAGQPMNTSEPVWAVASEKQQPAAPDDFHLPNDIAEFARETGAVIRVGNRRIEPDPIDALNARLCGMQRSAQPHELVRHLAAQSIPTLTALFEKYAGWRIILTNWNMLPSVFA